MAEVYGKPNAIMMLLVTDELSCVQQKAIDSHA
jgi:hypothetical protein